MSYRDNLVEFCSEVLGEFPTYQEAIVRFYDQRPPQDVHLYTPNFLRARSLQRFSEQYGETGVWYTYAEIDPKYIPQIREAIAIMIRHAREERLRIPKPCITLNDDLIGVPNTWSQFVIKYGPFETDNQLKDGLVNFYSGYPSNTDIYEEYICQTHS